MAIDIDLLSHLLLISISGLAVALGSHLSLEVYSFVPKSKQTQSSHPSQSVGWMMVTVVIVLVVLTLCTKNTFLGQVIQLYFNAIGLFSLYVQLPRLMFGGVLVLLTLIYSVTNLTWVLTDVLALSLAVYAVRSLQLTKFKEIVQLFVFFFLYDLAGVFGSSAITKVA